MTVVYLEQIGDRYIFKANGHANYAASGSDIVCAGVSALAQSFIQLVADSDAYTIEMCNVRAENGTIDFICEDSTGALTEAFNMLSLGLEMIANTYPDYVQVDHK